MNSFLWIEKWSDLWLGIACGSLWTAILFIIAFEITV